MSGPPNHTAPHPHHPVLATLVTAAERLSLSRFDTSPNSSPMAARPSSLLLASDVPERLLVQRIGSSPMTPHAPPGDTFAIYHGSIVQSRSLHTLEFMHDAYIGVAYSAKTNKGIIEFIVGDQTKIPNTPHWQNAVIRELGRSFLIPGMIDTHTHAPQFPNAGTGRIPLLDWLKKYTFPTESKFKNLGFAEAVYTRKVQRLISSGTTTACYYATIHLDASLVLRDVVKEAGQRAFIGKVCMDQNAPDFYVETTEQSVADTEKFVEALTKGPGASHLIQPIITPRFAPTCSAPLLSKLGDIAHDHNLTIQTHISENKDEILWVKSLFPDCPNYASVYDRHRLLTDRTVLAHAIHLTPEEKKLIKDRKSGVSHCPNSNFSISSGVLDCGALLLDGIKVGLGTDVSGGYHYSMLDAVRQSVIAARSVEFMKRAIGQEDSKANKPTSEPIDSSIDSSVLVTLHPNETPEFFDYQEAFYIATVGGSQLVGLEDKIGRLRVGYEFDAVLIDPLAFHSPFDVFDKDTPIDLFQKFMFLGDDRNVSEVYVSGRLVYTNGLPTTLQGTAELEASPRVAALAERLKTDSASSQ